MPDDIQGEFYLKWSMVHDGQTYYFHEKHSFTHLGNAHNAHNGAGEAANDLIIRAQNAQDAIHAGTMPSPDLFAVVEDMITPELESQLNALDISLAPEQADRLLREIEDDE